MYVVVFYSMSGLTVEEAEIDGMVARNGTVCSDHYSNLDCSDTDSGVIVC